jgi:AcrR family transcriptional regulator
MSEALDVWTRPERGRRRPRYTRDEIAAAAIRIADEEGLEELSMRRLAAELGAGTMTLYHYVRTKDELLALLHDAIMAELLVPDDELPDDWREALTVIARRSRDALRRHPWVLDVHDDPAPGPNAIRHWDQSMQAVSRLDLAVGERFELITAVDEHVFGFCLMERQNGLADDGPPGPELDAMRAYVEGLVETGEYPALAAIWEDPGLEEAWTQMQRQVSDPDRFDRNLARLLDGFEAELSRSSPAATSPRRRTPRSRR